MNTASDSSCGGGLGTELSRVVCQYMLMTAELLKVLGKTCSHVYPLCHVVRKYYTWWTGNEATTSAMLQYARTVEPL